ncbi:MAG TPA: trypsin-like peptidase domain-containing protein [Mycobacteriales bacterium]|nr:trypsin-like peptidase domain-containing protein [Mycobacteriales bacterium]
MHDGRVRSGRTRRTNGTRLVAETYDRWSRPMASLLATRRVLPALLALPLAGTVLFAAPVSASPPPGHAVQAAPAIAVAADLTATIRLSNCSAALVRYPSSLSTDRAMMLTNGHCFEGGFLAAGQVITNRTSTRRGTLLSSAGSAVATLTADRVLYATMTGTDVTLYRLTSTFAAIQSATGISARTISASHPVTGDTFVPSGFFARVFDCDIQTFVPTLREDAWTWHDSIRYNTACATVHGTSGSPIVNTGTGEIVGINNTANDNGGRCTLNNPCEVSPTGVITATQGLRYGQETYWFTTCLTASRTINLNQAGCLLTRPGG